MTKRGHTMTDIRRSKRQKISQDNEVLTKVENVKTESVPGDNSEDESGDEVSASAYEKKRLQNIQDNKMFLSELGIFQAKEEFQLLSGKKKRPSLQIKTKKEPREVAPRRISLRLANKEPDNSVRPRSSLLAEPVNEHPRKTSGPIAMSEAFAIVSGVHADEGESFLASLQKMAVGTDVDDSKEFSSAIDSYTKSLYKMKTSLNLFTKVVKDRIFSVAIHPSQTKVLAVAGDKWGKIGFWDVDSTDEKTGGVSVYEPHSRPVNCLKFDVNDPQKLFSCSYDGTVRCCDIERGVFDEVYRSSTKYEERCIAFDFVDPHTVAVGLGDGSLVLQDTRQSRKSEQYEIQERVVKCVSVHPLKSHFICTSSNDGQAYLWDTRNLKVKKSKPCDTLHCSRSVSSAYFSPLTGHSILTTSLDDRLRIYDASNMDEVKVASTVMHNNHVGRWLTPFRAQWHPTREDVFVVGSMHQPRQIEIYNDKCQVVKVFQAPEILMSVCSINALHPSRSILVGGNSSGRLFVFK